MAVIFTSVGYEWLNFESRIVTTVNDPVLLRMADASKHIFNGYYFDYVCRFVSADAHRCRINTHYTVVFRRDGIYVHHLRTGQFLFCISFPLDEACVVAVNDTYIAVCYGWGSLVGVWYFGPKAKTRLDVYNDKDSGEGSADRRNINVASESSNKRRKELEVEESDEETSGQKKHLRGGTSTAKKGRGRY